MIKKVAKASVKISMVIAVSAVVSIATLLLAYFAPRVHREFIRHYVGSKVVMISDRSLNKKQDKYSGGTGFHIQAPSGKIYIVTNRHVCDLANKKDEVFAAVRGETSYKKLKVIKRSDFSDLCIIEPLPEVKKGLKIGLEPEIGETIAAVGHPNLQPKTITIGEVVGYDEFTFPIGVIGRDGFKESQCKNKDNIIREYSNATEAALEMKRKFNKNKIVEQFLKDENDKLPSLKKIRLCLVSNMSLVTTVMAYHGSSGSPIVNFYGEVVGVVYAINEDRIWARGVPLADLKKFLADK